MIIYPRWVKIEWSKEFLSPGLRRLIGQTNLNFTPKEWVKFFDWAYMDRYNMITRSIIRRKDGRNRD